ncbi:PD-(D/E)XK nuclease family protein [Paenibacillus alvei]|uniref:PD-(D/E)XK nuclease family protein n=1 Tax=Paenibacillus alvei TaxID=44250 RepID=UPI003D2D4D8E
MQRKLYPEWSWSPSRHVLFEECRRKYYYHYYASHNGWFRDAPPLARQAYQLKQMTNLHLVFGEAMHKMAEATLMQMHQSGRMMDAEDIVRRVRNLLNQAYTDSLNVEAWKELPKQRTMLHEMYYGGQLPTRTIEMIKTRIPILADRFLNSRSVQQYREDSDVRLMELERLNTIEVASTNVFVKLDVMFRHHDHYIIVDWKTGQEDERNKTQLRLYGLYVHRVYGVPYEKLDIRTEYLLSGSCVEDAVYEEEMEELERHVVDSMLLMRDYLEEPLRNQPMSIDAFEPTDEVKRCRRCPYLDICEYGRREEAVS